MTEQRIQVQDRIVIPAGHVILEVVHTATGEVVEVKDLGENLIVNTYREYLKYLLAGEDMADYAIETMRIGTSGLAAAVTDEFITDPVGGACEVPVTHSIDSVSKVLTMTASFGVGAWDGEVFQEVGLLFANGGLMARRTFGAMTKSAEFTWNWSWSLSYTPTPPTDSVIVDAAYDRVMSLLAGIDQSDQYINTIQLGAGTTSPLGANTALTMPVMSKAVINVERGDPGDYWVRFDMYLGADEGNGFTYTEAGLLVAETGLGVVRLFAHTLTGVADEKDSDHQFGFRWIIFT